MGKSQQLLRELRAGGGVRFQQAVLGQLIGVGRGIGEAVHDVTDVIENFSGQLRENIVPLGL